MNYALVNLDKKVIVSLHEKEADGIAAGEAAKYDFAVANTQTWAGFSVVDLAHYFNSLVDADKAVARFSDRAAGIRRLNDVLHLVGTKVPTKAKRAGRKAGNGSFAAKVKSLDGLKMHAESLRAKVLDFLIEKGETALDDIVAAFSKDGRDAVVGSLRYLQARDFVK